MEPELSIYMMSHFILEAHIQSIGLANHHNDSFLFQMNHPEYTRNTRTVPAIPGYPELFKIPGIIPGIPGKLPKFLPENHV